MNGLGLDGRQVPALVAALLAIAGTAMGACLISLVARRTPLSLALTGRAWRRRPVIVSPVSAQAPSSAIASSVTTMAP
jgi:hypothetical protein